MPLVKNVRNGGENGANDCRVPGDVSNIAPVVSKDAILTTPTTTHAGASASGAEAGASASPRINNPILLDFSVEVELPAFV